MKNHTHQTGCATVTTVVSHTPTAAKIALMSADVSVPVGVAVTDLPVTDDFVNRFKSTCVHGSVTSMILSLFFVASFFLNSESFALQCPFNKIPTFVA